MAKKITELNETTTLNENDLFVVVQDGETKNIKTNIINKKLKYIDKKTISINLSQNTWTDGKINFDKTYPNIPSVYLQAKSYNGISKRIYQPIINNITTSSCEFKIFNIDGSGIQEIEAFIVIE